MSYEVQIKKWVAQKYNIDICDIHSVEMHDEFSEGYACCGGSNPDCYCSFAESASMDLFIDVYGPTPNGEKGGRIHHDRIDLKYGNIGKMVQEIFEA